MAILFVEGKLILEKSVVEGQCVLCQEGQIVHVGPMPKRLPNETEIVKLNGKYLAPGYVDIHVHGGRGADFMDGTCQAIEIACAAHLRHGVTSIFPTSTTGRTDQILAMVDAVKTLMNRSSQDEAVALPNIEGVHLYGPYFAPDKVGCHSPSGSRPPTMAENKAYFQSGIIRIATCAAELEGATEFYKMAKKRGCLITCGHSNSSWSEMKSAFKHGMRHVDHFWCAMSSIPSLRARFGTPMQASMAEFVYAHPEMSTEVIADGFHLSPELLRFAWQMKSAKKLCLVSDCNRALDMPPGRYAFGSREDENWFVNDGNVGRGENGALTSSIVALDTMVQNMHRLTDVPLHDIIRMASLTPAERTNISDRVGSIARGKQANLLVLSNRLKVEQIYLGGRRVLTK